MCSWTIQSNIHIQSNILIGNTNGGDMYWVLNGSDTSNMVKVSMTYNQGLCSLSRWTSYPKISWSFEAVRFGLRLFQSRQASREQQRCRDAYQKFRAIRSLYNIQTRNSLLRDFAVRRPSAKWREAQDTRCRGSLSPVGTPFPTEQCKAGQHCPDSKVHGANMGPIWGRQGPGGPHVGHMNFAIWVAHHNLSLSWARQKWWLHHYVWLL